MPVMNVSRFSVATKTLRGGVKEVGAARKRVHFAESSDLGDVRSDGISLQTPA